MMTNKVPFNSVMFIVLGHYVVFAHIIGGILMTAGLFTRIAALIQIPILLAAIVFVNSRGDMLRPYSGLFLSVLVLILLIYFLLPAMAPGL